MKVDLHFHTTVSDGTLSPEEIVSLAAKLGFNIIAVTDHDSVDGVPLALAAAQAFPNLIVVPGVELNADIPQEEVHILGYFIDYANPELCSTLRWLCDSRRSRATKMVDKLHSLGIDIDWHRVHELAPGTSIGRPHIAQALVEQGYVSSIRDAFVKYIDKGGPAYVEHARLTPVEAVKLITRAHGLPVLAHPAGISRLREFLGELKDVGLIGLEVFYNHYPRDVVNKLLTTANEYGLVPTGGSDFHGLEGESMDALPEIVLPQESIEKLFALVGRGSELQSFRELATHSFD